MDLETIYLPGLIFLLVAAFAAFVALMRVSAPYGRHRRGGWGPMINARLVWVVQESPSTLLFAWVFFQGPNALDLVPLVLFAMWQAHYFQRTFIFPFLMRLEGKKDPVLTLVLALVFNTMNATLNAYAISRAGAGLDPSWLLDPRFIAGAALFVAGYAANRHSDAVLRSLRSPGEKGYKIPKGGLFRWVSCPNYLGEIIEWGGWALASWSLAGLAFFIFTTANLLPRALSNHRWYRETFPDYPPERRALLPRLL